VVDARQRREHKSRTIDVASVRPGFCLAGTSRQSNKSLYYSSPVKSIIVHYNIAKKYHHVRRPYVCADYDLVAKTDTKCSTTTAFKGRASGSLDASNDTDDRDTNESTQAQEDVAKAVVTYTGLACALLWLCE